MSDPIIYGTINHTPLLPTDGDCPKFKVEWVRFAVKKGIEIQINSDQLADQNADCWFALKIQYARDDSIRYSDRLADSDVLITNGHDYFFQRRSTGKSRLVLNKQACAKIATAIRKLVKKL